MDDVDSIEAKEAIRKMIRDPVTKMLTQHSQLTITQLETLLAASVTEDNASNKSQRRFYCPSRSHISRGSYNRSLIQAQNNVIRSVYTVLLLGYVRLFDSSALQPFLELSDAIQGFIQDARSTNDDDHAGLQELNSRLLETIEALARRHSFKDKL
jgi:hypothetical protein